MKKFGLLLLLALTAALVCVSFSSCESDGYHALKFESNGGDAVEAQYLPDGVAANLPKYYSRAGYDFLGWYYDDGTWESPYYGEAIDSDTTIYACWEMYTAEVTFALNGGTTSDGRTGTIRTEVGVGAEVEPPEVTNGEKTFAGWYIDGSPEQWTGGIIMADTRISARWITPNTRISFDTVLPHIFISTENGEDITSTSRYLNATVSVEASVEDDVRYEFTELTAGIRGRGNSTWGFEKKPYRLKFAEKCDLFGMGAAKDWILLANYIDISLMRNYVMSKLALYLGDPYTSDTKWCHVYINGEYQGVYLACEQVESGKNRVNIEWNGEAPADVTQIGFLIEMGNPGVDDGDKTIRIGGVNYKGRNYSLEGSFGVIKYPKAAECSNDMVSYISDCVNEVNEAIFKRNWEDICELCDVDTFVDNFIVSEYLLSNDMGWVFFLYKEPGGKVCLGPLWDFDQAAGDSEHGGGTYEGWASGTPHNWFTTLIQMDEFRELVIERWLENYDYLHGIPEAVIQSAADGYARDIELNFERWPYMIGYSHWRSLPEMDDIETYQGHVDYLKDWLENRMAWIERELGIG